MSVQAAAWLGLAAADSFGLAALPYCSFSTRQHAAFHRVGVRVGDRVLDLTTATERLLAGRAALFRDGTLDPFQAAEQILAQRKDLRLYPWVSRSSSRLTPSTGPPGSGRPGSARPRRWPP